MSKPFKALASACAVLGTLLILVLAIGSAQSSLAGGNIGVIAIDLDTTGNTVTPCTDNGDPATDYPCNDSTTLGTIQNCRVIGLEETIMIDIVGIAIPNGGDAASDDDGAGAGQSDMALDWTPAEGTSPIRVSARDTSVALIHQGLDDNPGGQFSGTNGPVSQDGHWEWSDVDVNPDLVGEGGPGIAIRLSITGIAAGTAQLSLGINLLSQATWTDIHGNEYSVGERQGATIIVGSGSCQGGTPTTAPTPTPTLPVGETPTPTQPGTPTPTLPVGETPTPTQPGTPTPTLPVGETPTPTQQTVTPTITAPSQTVTNPPTTPPVSQTPTATPTATPPGSGTRTGTVGAGSGTPTPKSLPQTGGPNGDGGSSTLVIMLAFGAVLIATAGGSLVVSRARRED